MPDEINSHFLYIKPVSAGSVVQVQPYVAPPPAGVTNVTYSGKDLLIENNKTHFPSIFFLGDFIEWDWNGAGTANALTIDPFISYNGMRIQVGEGYWTAPTLKYNDITVGYHSHYDNDVKYYVIDSIDLPVLYYGNLQMPMVQTGVSSWRINVPTMTYDGHALLPSGTSVQMPVLYYGNSAVSFTAVSSVSYTVSLPYISYGQSYLSLQTTQDGQQFLLLPYIYFNGTFIDLDSNGHISIDVYIPPAPDNLSAWKMDAYSASGNVQFAYLVSPSSVPAAKLTYRTSYDANSSTVQRFQIASGDNGILSCWLGEFYYTALDGTTMRGKFPFKLGFGTVQQLLRSGEIKQRSIFVRIMYILKKLWQESKYETLQNDETQSEKL